MTFLLFPTSASLKLPEELIDRSEPVKFNPDKVPPLVVAVVVPSYVLSSAEAPETVKLADIKDPVVAVTVERLTFPILAFVNVPPSKSCMLRSTAVKLAELATTSPAPASLSLSETPLSSESLAIISKLAAVLILLLIFTSHPA